MTEKFSFSETGYNVNPTKKFPTTLDDLLKTTGDQERIDTLLASVNKESETFRRGSIVVTIIGGVSFIVASTILLINFFLQTDLYTEESLAGWLLIAGVSLSFFTAVFGAAFVWISGEDAAEKTLETQNEIHNKRMQLFKQWAYKRYNYSITVEQAHKLHEGEHVTLDDGTIIIMDVTYDGEILRATKTEAPVLV